jgi:hypothetical protein
MLFKTTLILWTDYDTRTTTLSNVGYDAENGEHTHIEHFTCEGFHQNEYPKEIYEAIYGPTLYKDEDEDNE